MNGIPDSESRLTRPVHFTPDFTLSLHARVAEQWLAFASLPLASLAILMTFDLLVIRAIQAFESSSTAAVVVVLSVLSFLRLIRSFLLLQESLNSSVFRVFLSLPIIIVLLCSKHSLSLASTFVI